MPELPRAGPPGHRGALPRVPQARRRAHQGEEGRPPGRRGRLLRLPRRARRGRRRPPPLRRRRGSTTRARPGFALDGLHAPLDCKACHKARTFLGLSQPCASCHKDVHNGTLGATCQTCHPTNVAFKDTRKTFDHAKTKYPLTGAHAKTPCESCHKTKGNYRIARFGACEDCHRNPHTPSLGTCTACHVTASFKTLAEGQKFDHAKTGYPLKGKHAAVACQACHVKPAALVTLKFTRCADCHQDVHKGVFPADDCAACHTEAGFRPAKFDHTARTKFPLDGKHATATCVACHKQAGAPGSRRHAARAADRRVPRREGGLRVLPRRRPQGQARRDLPDLPRDDDLQARDLPAPARGRNSSGEPTRAWRARSATRPRRRRRPAHPSKAPPRRRRRAATRASRSTARPATRTRISVRSARTARSATVSRRRGTRRTSSRTRPRSSRSRASTRPCRAPSATRRKRERSPRARGRPCG